MTENLCSTKIQICTTENCGAYTQGQNGMAEKNNRTLMGRIRGILINISLDH